MLNPLVVNTLSTTYQHEVINIKEQRYSNVFSIYYSLKKLKREKFKKNKKSRTNENSKMKLLHMPQNNLFFHFQVEYISMVSTNYGDNLKKSEIFIKIFFKCADDLSEGSIEMLFKEELWNVPL